MLLETSAGGSVSTRNIVLYGRTCSSLSDLVLSNQTLLRIVLATLMHAETFEIEYRMAFVTARIRDMAENLYPFNFLHGGSFNDCLRHFRIAKCILRGDTARSFVGTEAKFDFDITYLKTGCCYTAFLEQRCSSSGPLIAAPSVRSVQRLCFSRRKSAACPAGTKLIACPILRISSRQLAMAPFNTNRATRFSPEQTAEDENQNL